jgi:hypothetical protein
MSGSDSVPKTCLVCGIPLESPDTKRMGFCWAHRRKG